MRYHMAPQLHVVLERLRDVPEALADPLEHVPAGIPGLRVDLDLHGTGHPNRRIENQIDVGHGAAAISVGKLLQFYPKIAMLLQELVQAR